MIDSILKALTDSLLNISSVTSIVRSGFLLDANSFDAIAILQPKQTREHYGANSKLLILEALVRGYTYNDEDSTDASEALARQIEAVVDSFAESNRSLGIHSARVLAITTDSGLLSPYGNCDINIEIIYENTDN
jgi:hypothetical protein